uniref:GST N-terminal domain-containing protein n=1 Tax=Polytomella parva TaxID=51329 RepID=A0A7S0UVV8_9CHLO|mmetsp:Transcript_19990/g.35958  ORF Transcript_19990/g.35958 Transcript_19990/m.35958 type:complete len:343 (+) Transcript_19990:87-1115(+)
MLLRRPFSTNYRQKYSKNGTFVCNTNRSVKAYSALKLKEDKVEFKNIGPPPKRYTMVEGQSYDVYSTCAAIAIRGGSGGLVHGYGAKLIAPDSSQYSALSPFGKQLQEWSDVETFPRPKELLEFYDLESNADCKKVRESFAILDLDAKVFPCPKEGKTWRPRVKELGGKTHLPFLVDKNTGRSIYNGDDIVKYLFETYGNGQVPLSIQPGFKTSTSCNAALILRFGRGGKAVPILRDNSALKPITFWGYELSPFSTLVREVLSELELSYVQITPARGSKKRISFFQKHGNFQVPYIEDPNEGVCLFESASIIKYLFDTYALNPKKARGYPKNVAASTAAVTK